MESLRQFLTELDGFAQNNGGGGPIQLAPAVLQEDGTAVSADFLGTFPDFYQGSVNPKYDFGPVNLVVTGGGTTAAIGPVPYADTDGGNARGWVFDFDISSNPQAQQALQDPEAAFYDVETATWTTGAPGGSRTGTRRWPPGAAPTWPPPRPTAPGRGWRPGRPPWLPSRAR